ncbi:replicative DNA helicase [Chitinivorax sp. PXF-14]|uniref:replicative DNA helicase n=1 Tax=Chitinivorax sp. PXF-14 TaxID=3230488 RepID=UPI0034650233
MPQFDLSPIPDQEMQMIKLPPHSVEAEQSVLGGLLLDNRAWDNVAGVISEGDFYRHDHRLVFRHLYKLLELGHPADVVTVAESLEKSAELQEIGGLAYLAGLAQNTPSSANIGRYAQIVRERAIMRKLVEVGTEIADSAYNPMGRDAGALLDQAEAKVFEIAENSARGRQDFLTMPQLVAEVVERIDTLYNRENPNDITGIPTGFIDLDNMTSGLQRGDLIIVAGRPSMGKTAFSVNIAENIAVDSALPVAIFSMEMGGAQLVMRMIGSVGKLDQHKIKTGRLEDEDWQRLTTAVGKLSEAPIFIDESAGLTALELRARARRLARQHGQLGVIVIDYIQLMAGNPNSRDSNRAAEVSEISRALKSLAKELKVPVIALSQLSRNVESRPDKRPMMSDLRESGAIEQDADIIIFMFRAEYYDRENEELKGKAEAIISKHRNGPTGSVPLTFLGQYSRFENAAFRPTGWGEE